MATAVAAAISKNHPERKLIVVSSWPAVWINNPDIYRFYPMGLALYFYEDYIKDKDTLIFKSEPYHHQDFINKKRSLPDIWCEQLGVNYKNEETKIILTLSEKDKMKTRLKEANKPVLALQTNGGGCQDYPISWVRDVPLENLTKLIEGFQQEYKIIHIRKKDQPSIDSFAQHVAKALFKPSVVLWPLDNVKTLGYPSFHKNIISTAKKRKTHLTDSYLADYPIDGSNLHENPFDTNFIFDTKVIKEAV